MLKGLLAGIGVAVGYIVARDGTAAMQADSFLYGVSVDQGMGMNRMIHGPAISSQSACKQ